MGDAIQLILAVSAALLLAAAVAAVVRIALGPSILDRAVSADLLTSVGIAIVALAMIWWGRTDLKMLLIIFALTGLFSSTTISKFIVQEVVPSRHATRRQEKLAKDDTAAREGEGGGNQ